MIGRILVVAALLDAGLANASPFHSEIAIPDLARGFGTAGRMLPPTQIVPMRDARAAAMALVALSSDLR